ncbi:Ig-like domain-containing protein [Melissococcus plutonius]|uniref:Ig-like domain-containing protein n=1 Tax=Melissococcus plutonius TaxID=33970 RepID=UPI0021E5E60E|nr:Ig-like domain-containing protein [Melissococcus plutonius]
MTLNKQALTLDIGASTTLVATITPEDADNKVVTYTSSNNKIATVDKTGKVTAIKTGNVEITAKTVNELTAKCAVTVNNPVINVTEVKLNKQTLNLEVGATEKLTANVIPENATNKAVEFSVRHNSIASIDQVGLITAKGIGSTTITVTTIDGAETDECTLTVTTPKPPAD